MKVCFLPGSLCDGRVFAPQIHALASHGHECDVIDLANQTSIEAMAASVIDQTEPGSALVGISLGAIVAAEVVAQSAGHAAALALLSTNLDAPAERQLSTRRQWASQVRSGGFNELVADNLTETLTAFPTRHTELIFAMAMDAGPRGFLAQNQALLDRRDRRSDLVDFAGPVLILAGSEDHFCPPALHRQLAGRLPGARFEVIDGAGHLSTLDQSDSVNSALVEWLTPCASACGTTKIQTQEGTHEYQHA